MAIFYDPTSKTLNYNGFNNIYEKESLYQVWLDVEKALVKAQTEFGIIPQEYGDIIMEKCQISYFDLNNIENDFAKTGHGLIPVLNELCRIVGDDAAKYVHYGITTQNIQQTSELLISKKFTCEFKGIIEKIFVFLDSLNEESGHIVMAARTHSKQALPITLSNKLAVWKDEFRRAKKQLESINDVFQCMMGGAVGCFHTMPTMGPRIQKRVSELLNLNEMVIPSRSIRTHICQYFNALSIVGLVCAKIAEEIYISSSEEYNEITEGVTLGAIGSSTMPQKNNPRLCYGIIANSRQLFAIPTVIFNLAIRPFEADGCTNLAIDQSMREANLLAHEILLRTERLLSSIHIDEEAIQRNLRLSEGAISSENLMIKLAEKGIGKKQAHEVVRQIVSDQSTASFCEKVLNNEICLKHFSIKEIEEILTPKNYTGVPLYDLC